MLARDNELEILHTDIECLEVGADLIASGSHNKARTAIIVLHHLIETLLHRECQEILGRDRLMRWVIEPRIILSERNRVERSFADKVFLVRDKTTHLAPVDEAVLLIGHSYRNAIHHRDTHNVQPAQLLAKLLLRTTLRVFMRSGSETSMGGFATTDIQWVAKYLPLSRGFIELRQLRRNEVRRIAPLASVSFPESRDTLARDIASRIQGLTGTLEVFFGPEWNSYLDDLLKHVEFQIKNEKQYDDISKIFREATYRIQSKHPPTREEYMEAESCYKANLKMALDSFRPTHTISRILSLDRLAESISCTSNLRGLVLAYQKADVITQEAEFYIGEAHAIVEDQCQRAIDHARGK